MSSRVLAGIFSLFFASVMFFPQKTSPQTDQFKRFSQEMGMIVFARDYCGFPLSEDFRGALRQMQNGRWVEVFRENFEAGKRMGQASSALGGKKFFCFSTCVAHGPKRRGGSGAFRYCQ